jgi:hypothetical protein
MDAIAAQAAEILARGEICIAEGRQACERARRLAREARTLRALRQTRMMGVLSEAGLRGWRLA